LEERGRGLTTLPRPINDDCGGSRVLDEEETDRHFVAKPSSKVAGNIKGIKGIY
jgi:hypothetical protein